MRFYEPKHFLLHTFQNEAIFNKVEKRHELKRRSCKTLETETNFEKVYWVSSVIWKQEMSIMKKKRWKLRFGIFTKLIKTFALKGVNGTLIDKSWRTDLSTQQSKQSCVILHRFSAKKTQHRRFEPQNLLQFSGVPEKNLRFVPQCKNNRKLVSWTPNSSVTDY